MNPLGINRIALQKPRVDVSKLSVRAVMRMSDKECRQIFTEIRWGGKLPICPKCANEGAYWLEKKKIFKCRTCGHQYSLTSGTIFSGRKLPLTDYLCAVVLFVQAVKGISSLHLARNLEITGKSAFVILHKIREAIERSVDDLRLSGVIEVDGATFGGYRRSFNHASQMWQKRRYLAKNDNKHVVVIARSRFGRSFPFVGETEGQAAPMIKKMIESGSVIVADGGHAWDGLNRLFDMLRIDHSLSFSANNACTNMAESYFSVLRRMHMGVHHRIDKRNMHAYASELCWKQDFRAESSDEKVRMLLMLALNSKPSTKWAKYWQRNRQKAA
jgi:transposase-like protein